jgi:ribosomal protein S18 acetylase RimI-like enzyme
MNDKNVTLSKAGFNDLKEILELQKKAFISEAKLYNNFTIEPMVQSLHSIESEFQKFTFLKAEAENKIVGSVKGRETDEFCWIGRLIVDPEFQNMGIGKRLMKAIENEFPEVKQFLLFTGYKSIKNIKLYESLGYKHIETIVDIANPEIHMVKMTKENKK